MSDPFKIQNQDNTIKDNRIDNYFDKGLEGGFWFGGGENPGSLRILLDKKRIFLYSWVFFICLFIIFIRLFYLQINQGEHYRGIAEGNRIRIKSMQSNRGVIVDRNYRILARNIPKFSLFFIPADLPSDKDELNRILDEVAQIIEKPVLEMELSIEQAWKYSYEPVLIEEDIDFEKAILLKIKSVDLAGIFLETGARREYLRTGSGLAHILGYLGKLSPDEFGILKNDGYLINDYLGKTGVERAYENILRGEYGKKQIEVDFLGKEENVLSVLKPEPGKEIVLAIDFDLQEMAGKSIKNQMKKAGSKSGVVIVNEVETGDILAMVSLPDYDNNLFSAVISGEEYQKLIEDEDKPFVNRAISGEYPPGSIFKLLVAGGALEEGVIDRDTSVFSVGGIRIGEWFFPDWKAGGHGPVTVTKAIAESVNTFFYYVGGGYEEFEGLGLEKINYWAYLFGLGQKLGIDLIGEENGFLPTKQWKLKYKEEPWYIGDTYHLSIGQGDVLVTPLQVASYTSAIANGGTLYQPRVVRGFINRNETRVDSLSGDSELSFEPEENPSDQLELVLFEPNIIRNNFVDEKNLEIIREGMRDGVIYGSSRALYNLPIDVAGKTGTAQVGGDKEPHAWFTGFAPYEKPEIAVTVLIENGGEGSSFAVPVAREIFEYYFGAKEVY